MNEIEYLPLTDKRNWVDISDEYIGITANAERIYVVNISPQKYIHTLHHYMPDMLLMREGITIIINNGDDDGYISGMYEYRKMFDYG